MYDASIVDDGTHVLSVLISTLKFHVGVSKFVCLYIYTHVNLLLVAVNPCDSIYCTHATFHTAELQSGAVVKLWSILSVLPTAVKLTREGVGAVREFATGSITSSRVMELMSNQASETFQATEFATDKVP